MNSPDKLKFNKSLKSNNILLKILLDNKLETADPISKNIADIEIVVHTYKKRIETLQQLLDSGKISLGAQPYVHYLIEVVKDKLAAYQEKKKLTRLKKEEVTLEKPLVSGDEWMKGTPYAETYKKTRVYAVGKDSVTDEYLDKLENIIDQSGDEIQYYFDQVAQKYPEDFETIETAFSDLQKENRTN